MLIRGAHVSHTRAVVRRRAWALAVFATSLACESLPPIEYRGDHIEIGTFFSARVCAGSVLAIDDATRRISDALGLQGEGGRVRLYWGGEGVDEHCPGFVEHRAGCYVFEDEHAISRWAVIDHEVVHALGARIRTTDVTFEEGLAVGLSTSGLGLGTSAILDESFETLPDVYLGMTRKEFNTTLGSHHVAGHFSRWLVDTHGIEPLLEMRHQVDADASPDVISVEFENAFGFTLEAAEQAWTRQAPESYDSMAYGGDAPTEQWSGDELTIERTLDCDDASTLGPLTGPPFPPERDEEEGMYATATMDVLVAGPHRLELIGSPGDSVMLQRQGCWDYADDDAGLALVIEPDGAHDLILSGCRWLLVFASEDVDEARTMSLRLTRVGS